MNVEARFTAARRRDASPSSAARRRSRATSRPRRSRRRPWSPVARRGAAVRGVRRAPPGRAACAIATRCATPRERLDDLDIATRGERGHRGAALDVAARARRARVRDLRLRFRVTTPEGSRFVTGRLPLAPRRPTRGTSRIDDLWTSPYTRVRSAPRPHHPRQGRRASSSPSARARPPSTEDEIAQLGRGVARAPSPPTSGVFRCRARWCSSSSRAAAGSGAAARSSGGGGTVFVRIGERAPAEGLSRRLGARPRDDPPRVPVRRARAGLGGGGHRHLRRAVRARARRAALRGGGVGRPRRRAAERAARRRAIAASITRRPGAASTGAARSSGSSPTSRSASARSNRFGLEHALRGVLAAGGNNAARWPLEDDPRRRRPRHRRPGAAASSTPRWAPRPIPVDLAPLFDVARRRGLGRACALRRQGAARRHPPRHHARRRRASCAVVVTHAEVGLLARARRSRERGGDDLALRDLIVEHARGTPTAMPRVLPTEPKRVLVRDVAGVVRLCRTPSRCPWRGSRSRSW